MYKNSYQRGMLTVFFSGGSKPLSIWKVYMQDGYVSRFLDKDLKSMVLEIGGTNVSTTYITCPKDDKMTLGITMPFLVMIVKNLKKYFSFEVTILDETGSRRRFRVSNFQSTTQIQAMCTVMPIGLSDGWNQIQFNLAEFTRRAYKKQFVEVQRLKINANIRVRRIYFAERLVPDDELPPEYKLYFPLASKGKDKTAKQTVANKENKIPSQQALESVTVETPTAEAEKVPSPKKSPSQEEPEVKVESGAEAEEVKPETLEAAAQVVEEIQPGDEVQPEEQQNEIKQEVIEDGEVTQDELALPDTEEPAPPETAESEPQAETEQPEEAPA